MIFEKSNVTNTKLFRAGGRDTLAIDHCCFWLGILTNPKKEIESHDHKGTNMFFERCSLLFEAVCIGMDWHCDRYRQLWDGRRVCSAIPLHYPFNVELIAVFSPIQLAGLSSQLDGLGDSRKGI